MTSLLLSWNQLQNQIWIEGFTFFILLLLLLQMLVFFNLLGRCYDETADYHVSNHATHVSSFCSIYTFILPFSEYTGHGKHQRQAAL